MVSREDETGILILVKFVDEFFSTPNNVINDLDVAHVFLRTALSQGHRYGMNGIGIPWNEGDTNVQWYPIQVGGGI
jgi:hypothetical protein